MKMNAKRLGTVACTAFLKTLLLAFNLLFFTLGLVFFVIGVYGIRVFKEFFTFAPSNYIYVPFICIGAFMMAVGLLSLWCTPKGISWLLYVYGMIIFVLFIAVFAMAILFAVKHDTFESELKTGIERSIANYTADSESIDLLQSTIHCCGSLDYTDWFATQWADSKKSVPKSCCIDSANCANIDPMNVTQIYTKGCYKIVHDSIENNYQLVTGIGFASAALILLGSVLSCTLATNLRKNRYEQVE